MRYGKQIMFFSFGVLAAAGLPARAAMTLLTGPPIGSHVGNLVVNGSFETGAPAPGSANYVYWATGTASLPYAVPPGWSASGSANNYAKWGADSPSLLQVLGSDVLPDGQAGLYFGNYAGATSSLAPTFQPDGRVTFSGTPTMTAPKGNPVYLWQTVPTHMTPAPSYCLSLWASGEWSGQTPGGAPDGIFGLRVTNVLAGDPMQFFAVPGGTGALGASRRYEFNLVPLNPLAPMTIEFVNWGHFDLSAWGGSPFTSELVLDDVMINAVPEPATVALLGLGGIAMLRRRAARKDETETRTSFRRITMKSQRTLQLLVVGLCGLIGSQVALAQGVGNVGSLPNLIPMNAAGTGWDLGMPSPLPVVLNPTGPAWQKILVGTNNLPVVAVPGQTFYLHEVLTVSGTQPWSDWHEDILTPHWDWTGVQIFISSAIPAGLVVNNIPGNATQGGSLSFYFNPVPVGSTVDIFKHLTYQANPALPVFSSKVIVNEYPTPEPATLGLLTVGALAMFRRRAAKTV